MIDQDEITAARLRAMQPPVANDVETSRQARLAPVIESMEQHHRQRERDIRDLIEAVARIAGTPVERLAAHPPLRGLCRELIHTARVIASRADR